MRKVIQAARSAPLVVAHAAFAAALLASAAAWDESFSARAAETDTVVVHKDPNCGCCSLWVEHLEQAGFTVETRTETAMTELKARLGIPARLWSCHTGVVAGYVIEGHVPAADVRRLLEEKPQAAGLAVPGMPIGSPGMEIGDRKDPYEVLLFDESGVTTVFASY